MPRSLPTTICPCSLASMPSTFRPPCCPIRVRRPRRSIVPWRLRVGQIDEQRRTLTNTSFRIIGKAMTIEPGKSSAPQSYELFAGPKRPDAVGEVRNAGPGLLRLADLPVGCRAHDPDPRFLLHDRAQLRTGDHHADDRRPPGHVPHEPQAGAERPDDAEDPARDEGDPEEVQEGSRSGPQGPAGALGEAQLQSASAAACCCSSRCRSSSAFIAPCRSTWSCATRP